MPELPEVETMRRGILGIVGARIKDVERVPCKRRPIAILPRIDHFRRRAVEQRIRDVGRVGKRVIVHLDSEDAIVLEPRMTGLVLVAGCSSDDGGSGTKTAAGGVELVKAGQLTTCTHLPYPPFQSEIDGKVQGFDVSLIDLVADDLGVKQAILDTPFEVVPGIDVRDVLVTYTDRVTQLTGGVTDQAGRPVPTYSVIAFSTDSRYWRQDSRRVSRPVRPSTDGRFTIAGLPTITPFFLSQSNESRTRSVMSA